jgi:hypothetical protein
MERHETMMRAARYLLGAGTIAVAMVATTASPATAQTLECMGEAPTVCGHVFTEANMMDGFQEGEGTENITVVVMSSDGMTVVDSSIAQASNPTLSNACVEGANPLDCGYYSFDIFAEDGTDFQVCIVVDGQNLGCTHVTAGPKGQIVDFEVPNAPPPQNLVWGSGTGTPGYWKNHSSAWPVNEIVIGDPAVRSWTYTKEQAIAFLNKPVAGDKTYTIFASLVSAMLNVYGNANNPECIADDITKAHKWFSKYGPVGGGIKAKSDAWVGGPTNTVGAGEPIHTEMDDYNNGKLCAPHRN